MKSPDGRPKGKGPGSLIKRRFTSRAIDHGVHNPASPKKHKLDQLPTFINPPRSERELNRRLDLPKQKRDTPDKGMLRLSSNVQKAVATTRKFANMVGETLFVILQSPGCSWLATRQERIRFGVVYPGTKCLEVKPTYTR